MVLNTDLAASFVATTWLFVEWSHARKPHFVRLLTGAVAGLATITPAAGFIPIYASVIIGIVSGLVCYYAVQLKNRLRWDDALDVWGVHGVGGTLGIILLGLVAPRAAWTRQCTVDGVPGRTHRPRCACACRLENRVGPRS